MTRRIDFLTKRLDHAWLELLLRKAVCGIADHALLFGQLIVEEKGIGPVKGCHFGHGNLHLRFRLARLFIEMKQVASEAVTLNPSTGSGHACFRVHRAAKDET